MTFTIISANYANPEHTAAVMVTEEAGAVAVSLLDSPELWADLHEWGTPDDYVEPAAPRRQVLKAVVEQRLIEAGLMDAAFAALSSSGVLFVRWYSRISDSVFFDDPDALALLDAIGADPEVIMAP